MTREEMKELNGLAASMGIYDDKNPCKRAVILGKAIKELEQEPTTKNELAVDAVSRQTINGYREVLDKIRAEIEKQEKWLLQAGYNAYNVDIAFNSIKLALAESEIEDENDD